MLPANVIAGMKRGSGMMPILLVDVQLADGTILHWSDFEGTFPMKLGVPGEKIKYEAKLKHCGPFRLSRSLKTDAGDVMVHNLSGRAPARDVSSVFAQSEFEGALVVVRWWDIAFEYALWEFHCYWSEPSDGEQEVGGRLLQLFDPSQLDAPMDTYSEQCTLEYKSERCGSTSAQLTCAKSIGDCTVRIALERFNGTPHPPPVNLQTKSASNSNVVVRGGGQHGGGIVRVNLE